MALFGLFGSSAASAAAPPMRDEHDALFSMKRNALELAAATAAAEGRQPTITDYITAAESLRPMAEQQGMAWSPRIYSDLSGQTVHGFLIRREDIDGAGATIKAARGGSMSDEDALTAGYEFRNNIRYERTIFEETVFRPATTYEPERARGASFSNVTFDDMKDGDHVTLVRLDNGRGGDQPYTNIRFTNIRGGTVSVADGANVQGFNIEGARARLEIGRAVISNLQANSAHLLSFQAARGASFTNGHFEGATIDGNSNLAGTVWNDVHFDRANLDSVDMRGSQLTNVSFTDAHIDHLDLRGARLKDVSFSGVNLTHLKFDATTRFNNVTVDGRRFDTPEALQAFITTQAAAEAAMGAGSMLNTAMFKPSGITAPVIAASTAPLALANPGGDQPPAAPEVQKGTDIWAHEIEYTPTQQITPAAMMIRGGEHVETADRALNSHIPKTDAAIDRQNKQNQDFALAIEALRRQKNA